MKYYAICKPENMDIPDINTIVLFGLAVLVIFVSFNTPELQVVLEMTDEEIEETEF